MSGYAIGVDVGGSAIKAGVYDLGGALVGSASVEHRPHQPSPGVAEYAPHELMDGVERSISGAMRASGVDARDIVAVGGDAMVSGTVGLSDDGTPTTAYTTTLDTRFAADLEAMSGHADAVRSLSGSGTPVIAAKIAWHRRTQPEEFARTRVFVTAGGLLACHLAGLSAEDAVIDTTVLWAVGLSDTVSGHWSPELTTRLDVPATLLPRIVEPATVVGGIARDVAARTGLREGTPVIAGLGDQAAGFLGSGALLEGALGNSAGTFEVVGRGVETFAPDPEGKYDVLPSGIGTGYVQQAVSVIGGGFSRRWLTELLGRGADETRLEDEATAAGAGADGLLCLPHLGGQATPSRPWVRGGWLGATWSHSSGHFARALVEAVAYELDAARGAFGGPPPDRVIGYGGGTRSALANQVKADVLGIPFVSLGDIAPGGAAAALLAAVGTGHRDRIGDLVRHASATTYRPSAEAYRAYAGLIRDYRAALALAAGFRRPEAIDDEETGR